MPALNGTWHNENTLALREVRYGLVIFLFRVFRAPGNATNRRCWWLKNDDDEEEDGYGSGFSDGDN
jgi:hypothetical protein